MDPEKIATEVIPRICEKHGEEHASIHLSIPSFLSDIPSPGGTLETLLERFLGHVLAVSHPSRCIRIAVREKKKAKDLESFFSISPRYWFRLSVECQSTSGLENGAKTILGDLGYHCPEWVGVEGSESQLGAFHYEAQRIPSIILFIQNRGARRGCDFLIPIMESVHRLAHAV